MIRGGEVVFTWNNKTFGISPGVQEMSYSSIKINISQIGIVAGDIVTNDFGVTQQMRF